MNNCETNFRQIENPSEEIIKSNNKFSCNGEVEETEKNKNKKFGFKDTINSFEELNIEKVLSNQTSSIYILDSLDNSVTQKINKTQFVGKSLNEMNSNKEYNRGFLGAFSDSLANIKNTIKFNLISSNKQVNFKKETSITIQGRKFTCQKGQDNPAYPFIVNNFLYITYRNNFNGIECSSTKNLYTTDCGWGCMIRAAQMIMAKTILEIKKNNRNLKYKGKSIILTILTIFHIELYLNKKSSSSSSNKKEIVENSDLLKETILLFSDNFLELDDIFDNSDYDYFRIKKYDSRDKNNASHLFKKNSRVSSIINLDIIETEDVVEYFVKRVIPPFSIQFICRLGEMYNKGPGKHFSDVNMIQIFDELNNEFHPIPELEILWSENSLIEKNIIDKFTVKIEDPVYIEENIERLYLFKEEYYKLKPCFNRSSDETIFDLKQNHISGVIFISIRLGLNKVSTDYFQSIINLFSLPQNIGFIGGENLKGFYYFGANDNNELLFLDPHLNQKSFTGRQELKSTYSTYLSAWIYKLPVEKISPAFTVGFLFKDMNEFKEMIASLKEFTKANNSIFTFYQEEKNSLKNSSIMCIGVEDDFDLIELENNSIEKMTVKKQEK